MSITHGVMHHHIDLNSTLSHTVQTIAKDFANVIQPHRI
jgi:hypothetical protein